MINFGFVSFGQCGNKIADLFAKKGYKALAFNTTKKDLDGLKDILPEYRYEMLAEGTMGGAGKNPAIGAKATEEHLEEIMLRIDKYLEECNYLFLVAGLGGGTGSGALPIVLKKIKETTDKDIGLIVTIPYSNEGPEVKTNALKSMAEILSLTSEYKVPLMIIDNEKILGKMENNLKWFEANEDIVKPFIEFNKVVRKHSAFVTFDPQDYKKVLTVPGLFSMLKFSFPVEELRSEHTIIEKIKTYFNEEMITASSDYNDAQMAAVIVEAPEQVINDRYNEIMKGIDALQDNLGGISLYPGIYAASIKNGFARQVRLSDGKVNLYVLFSGMPAPLERFKEITVQAKKAQTAIKQKRQKVKESFNIESMISDIDDLFNDEPDIKVKKDNTVSIADKFKR